MRLVGYSRHLARSLTAKHSRLYRRTHVPDINIPPPKHFFLLASLDHKANGIIMHAVHFYFFISIHLSLCDDFAMENWGERKAAMDPVNTTVHCGWKLLKILINCRLPIFHTAGRATFIWIFYTVDNVSFGLIWLLSVNLFCRPLPVSIRRRIGSIKKSKGNLNVR